MALTEQEYNELYKFSLNQAHKFIGYTDNAYDIAQNAILAFLSSKTPIEKPKPWLSTVVKREIKALHDKEKKDNNLIKKTAIESKIRAQVKEEESYDFSHISIQKIMQYLGKKDFQLYQNFRKYEFSAKKISEKEKLPLETIKSHLRRIKRNIISGYLVEDGWNYGNRILNYNQYIRITRGISGIIESVKNKKISSLRNYFRRVDNELLEKIFHGVESCYEWSIRFENDAYKLLLVCTPLEPMPKFINLIIKFNQANFLYLIDATLKTPVIVTHGSLDKVSIYKEKGKINLMTDEVVKIISDKTTKS
jgi:DNA-directed RNA polymerase specialized sigma24 family protein